jgi:pilus assembly protein CpaC
MAALWAPTSAWRRHLAPLVSRTIANLLALAVMALTVLLSAGLNPASAQTVNYDLKTTSVMRINLPISQAVTVTFSEAVSKIAAADPTIADAQPITDKSVYVIGKAFGTTTVSLFSTAGTPVGLLSVEVGADTKDMARSIRAAVPNSNVKVNSVNGRVQLSGTVSDVESMKKVLEVVAQYGSPAIINTMTLVGGQQVNLQVRILEASRNAGHELGINWTTGGATTVTPGFTIGQNIAKDNSGTVFGASGQNVAGTGGTFATFITSILSGGVNLDLIINALETKGLVRTLAEPNLTTLSGQGASFLAGGQVPIRVPDSNGNATLSYKEFGVKLVFTPVVLDGDRIQIHLTPEVSDISQFTTAGDPVFTTRNLDSTVELRDGQSFSVAGLLQNNTALTQNQLPWIGDVPILGALFKSSSYQKKETELVVIVTPRLVQPDTPGQVVASPLDQTQPPNDPQFFALGQMEVTPKMIQGFQSGAGVAGPYGYIINLGPGSGK